MPDVHTRYVVWESRGYRHKSGSGAIDITSPKDTGVQVGYHYGAYAFPQGSWNDLNGTHTAYFAFWSVVGCDNGPLFSTDPNLDVLVDTADVQATAWYIDSGVGGPGTGLLIDAFDVDIGDFVLDDFVDVVTDPSLTTEANLDGIVPTTQAEDVRAYPSIRALPFNKWIVVEGSEATSAEDLSGAEGSSAIAFAMYRSNHGGTFTPPVVGNETWVSWGVTVDGGGASGRGPQPPWGPFVLELAAGLALAESSATVDQSLRAAVLRLAADQVRLAAGNIAEHMQGGAVGSG